MTDVQILTLAAAIFLGFPTGVLLLAIMIDRLRPIDRDEKPARKHRAF